MHKNGRRNGSSIKQKYRLRKRRKTNSLASASDALVAMGAHAENGVFSPQIFHFNH